jgi:predicted RNA-binding protein
MVRKELKHVKSLAKHVVPQDILKRIRRIKDRVERIDLYKHSIKSNLEMRMHNLEKEIKKKGKEHDVFHLIAKANLLNLKIKYFYISHDKKDLKKVVKTLKEIEKELNLIEVGK